MKAINKFPAILVVTAVTLAGLVRAEASQLLFSQFSDGQSTYGPSELWAPDGVNSEVADDFDVVGDIKCSGNGRRDDLGSAASRNGLNAMS